MTFFQGVPEHEFHLYSNPLYDEDEVFSDNQDGVSICEANECETNASKLPFFDDEKGEEEISNEMDEEACSLSSE